MLEAVLFDLDGVLVDSEQISSQASEKVLGDVGIVLSDEEKKRVFGRRTIDNYSEHIKSRGLDIDPHVLIDRKNRLFKKLIKGVLVPLPGVVELILGLKDARIPIALVSSSPLERVEASLDEAGLLWHFPVVVSGDCCRLGKPEPEPFLVGAERLGVSPAGCVVVEDAEAGVRAAKAAGMKCLTVESEHTHGQDLSMADFHASSLEVVDADFLRGLF